MARPKITEPLTDNAEKALRELRRRVHPPDEGHGGPARAHAPKSGGKHEKNVSSTAPKVGGRPKPHGTGR